MILFENGIDLQEKEFLPEGKEVLEDWIMHMINQRILQHKEAFKNRWFKNLESDPDVTAYPKNIDDCIWLIKKRPWYKTDEQVQREKTKNESLNTSKNQYKLE